MTQAEAAKVAAGLKWFGCTMAEYVPNGDYVKLSGLKWLRDNAASDEVNDKDFEIFIQKLMKHA